jgi:hypothetical protein
MPLKGQSPKEVVHTEMHKFKHGSLHSGSKHGPLVKSRKQAIAIALSESGKAKKATGGAAMKLAYEIRRAEGGQVFHGPIMSTVPGRTDQHDMDVASGSYVLPSETVSHLGENNTMAGLEKIKQLGPHGLRHMVRSSAGAHDIISKHKRRAAGGGLEQQSVGQPIPVVTAGGEHVLSPQEVGVIGDGDMTLGHRLLDNFVLKNRKKHISTLKALKPPAQD